MRLHEFPYDSQSKLLAGADCRAVLAAARQGLGPAMFHRIQQAYYLEARNPADTGTLIALAGELKIDTARFAADLSSAEIETALQADFHRRRQLQATAFPSLILALKGSYRWLSRGWEEQTTVLTRLEAILQSTAKNETL